MIADAAYFEYLETHLDELLARDPATLESVAERNVTIKGRIVEQDPEERGMRRILNYGHTIGHAVESASGYRLLHGEAVALGILAAARIAEELRLADESIGRRASALLGKLGMPAKLPPEVAAGALPEIMSRDKKALDARPRFVLLDRLGHAREENGEYVRVVDSDVVSKAVAALQSAARSS
jgi:3-dehydroquinate synthase